MIRLILPKHEIFPACFILILLSFFLTGCIDTFNQEVISSQTIRVNGFDINERIIHTGNWPDHTYERRYRAAHNSGRWVDLGNFEDESNDGMEKMSTVVDGRLVVLSSSHVFLWQPGSDPVHFEPFSAAGWYDYAQESGINGHYDINAAAVWKNPDGRWLIRYACERCQNEETESVLFYSIDNGQTFDICLAPDPNYSNCLD